MNGQTFPTIKSLFHKVVAAKSPLGGLCEPSSWQIEREKGDPFHSFVVENGFFVSHFIIRVSYYHIFCSVVTLAVVSSIHNSWTKGDVF